MSQHNNVDEQWYWQQWLESRDVEAGDILAKKYIPLVTYHVQRISVKLPKNVSREDLKSLGLVGLFDALERFDPNRDLKFETYASFRIKGAIIDGLRKEDWLPRSTREKSKLIESTLEKLEQTKMRAISSIEIAEEIGMTEEEVNTIMNENYFSNILSMDEYSNDQDDNESHSYSLRDDSAISPEDNAIKKDILTKMSSLISNLGEKEQLVLDLFYRQELTLTEIGIILKLSTSRISQIHSRALYKLRGLMEKTMNA